MYIPEPDTKLVFVMKTRTESRQKHFYEWHIIQNEKNVKVWKGVISVGVILFISENHLLIA